MEDLCPSLSKTKKMLMKLQTGKAEFSTIDCKEVLNLKEDGDCASFIRHIAALANTGQRSYLFIGLEDKTWALKGIAEDSPMRAVDSAQQQMNQILARRLDPPMTIGYGTYEVNGILIGVVALEGANPPYVVSIEDTKYGSKKTKGKESYVYSGVIYTRRGTDSVPIKRQSEILAILNGRTDYVEAGVSLVFIGLLVAGGIGVGSSLIRFGDAYSAALLGSIWGIFIGWLLNKRLVDTFGRYPVGGFGKAMKNIGGPLWGGTIGALLSYLMVYAIISSKIKVLDPISMGFFMAPFLAIFVIILSLELVYFIYVAVNILRKARE